MIPFQFSGGGDSQVRNISRELNGSPVRFRGALSGTI